MRLDFVFWAGIAFVLHQRMICRSVFFVVPHPPFGDGHFLLCPSCLGANVNAAKLHETALHHAAKVKNVDLIEMLIEFGGNIYARDNRGKKPSDYTWSSSAPAKCFEYYESEPGSAVQISPYPSVLVRVCCCDGTNTMTK